MTILSTGKTKSGTLQLLHRMLLTKQLWNRGISNPCEDKKHRNALAKLRLSDHQLHIQSGRQTRPKTPKEQRVCKKCPKYIEEEAHFLLDCSDDSDIKSDLVGRIAIDFPQISVMVDKYIRYKFIMKIQDPEILKSLGFSVNLLFKNRENRTKKWGLIPMRYNFVIISICCLLQSLYS